MLLPPTYGMSGTELGYPLTSPHRYERYCPTPRLRNERYSARVWRLSQAKLQQSLLEQAGELPVQVLA
eukprot:244081-Rhodomonas_salina.3